jgi:sulfate adenylyltransferase
MKEKLVKEKTTIPPHGGTLKNIMIDDPGDRQKLIDESKDLPRIKLSTLEFSDLIMLGTGAFSPLEGFMTEKDYQGVLKDMKLPSGTLWPLPVTITVDSKDRYKQGSKAALVSPYSDEIVGKILVEDIYPYDKEKEAKASFGTADPSHPGAEKLKSLGNYHIGGPVMVFSEGGYPDEFPQYGRPSETREIFAQKGWKTICAFQTRNPIHRSHEYLTKTVMEVFDGLFIHPIVGKLKKGDIPGPIRIKCYEALLDNYYPKDRVLLKVYPMEMRYAGPKEAILHAIIRQNYGCTHIIIGRDHAGVGNFYGAFEAQEIFDTLSDSDLLIKPVKMDWTFYCEKCNAMASFKTCPHPSKDHKMISGTRLREMLSNGQYPPEYITRKEVSDILIDYYRGLK